MGHGCLFQRQVQSHSTLKDFLIAHVQQNYLNLNRVSKWMRWIGTVGENRAQAYIKWLEEYRSLDETALFNQVLTDARVKNDQSRLSQSVNLRLLLVEALCLYSGIQLDEIEQKSRQIFANGTQAKTGPSISMEEAKLEAMFELINNFTKQRDSYQLKSL